MINQQHTITYYVPVNYLGDKLSEHNRDMYRDWSEVRLEEQYPGYLVTSFLDPSTHLSETSDSDKSEEIESFCKTMIDECDWEWDTSWM